LTNLGKKGVCSKSFTLYLNIYFLNRFFCSIWYCKSVHSLYIDQKEWPINFASLWLAKLMDWSTQHAFCWCCIATFFAYFPNKKLLRGMHPFVLFAQRRRLRVLDSGCGHFAPSAKAHSRTDARKIQPWRLTGVNCCAAATSISYNVYRCA
jgi:hypothetical protein